MNEYTSQKCVEGTRAIFSAVKVSYFISIYIVTFFLQNFSVFVTLVNRMTMMTLVDNILVASVTHK